MNAVSGEAAFVVYEAVGLYTGDVGDEIFEGLHLSYYIDAWKKDYFLVTPDEFAKIFDGFSFVVSNTGVEDGAGFSDPRDISERFRSFYELLASGKRCVWSEDYKDLGFSTGVTGHPENIRYKKGEKLNIPDFTEPCVELKAVCAVPWKGCPLSKGWAISQFPQFAIGLGLFFPSKISNENGEIKRCENLADNDTLNEIRRRIKAVAPVLKVFYDGKTVSSGIRVSNDARNDLRNFNAVKEIGVCFDPPAGSM